MAMGRSCSREIRFNTVEDDPSVAESMAIDLVKSRLGPTHDGAENFTATVIGRWAVGALDQP